MTRSLSALGSFMAASFGAAAVGGLATSRSLSSDWYADLRKPRWQPPGSAFGPVWTALYAQTAVSGWLVYRNRRKRPRAADLALSAWTAQLLLNAAWPVAFFGRRSPAAGLVVIAILWKALVETAVLSGRVDRRAGLLYLPHIGWVTFAAALNARIWALNRHTW